MTKPLLNLNESDIKKIIGEKIREVLKPTLNRLEPLKEATKNVISEAIILLPKTFNLKTEYLSQVTKENHFKLYKNYVDSHNLVSSKIDTTPKADANNPNNSEYRRLKIDEQHNMNGVKLHELYFTNISDLSSEIRMDTIPFQRLSKDWGTFENWQIDFRACGMAATEGWAILYWEPFKKKYMNTFIEKHSENIPVMGIPVLVIDTWHHAWFRDHPGDKMNYLNAMMKEINWAVVEARMGIAEMCPLNQLYMIEPVSNTDPTSQLRMLPTNNAPIGKDQIVNKIPVQ